MDVWSFSASSDSESDSDFPCSSIRYDSIYYQKFQNGDYGEDWPAHLIQTSIVDHNESRFNANESFANLSQIRSPNTFIETVKETVLIKENGKYRFVRVISPSLISTSPTSFTNIKFKNENCFTNVNYKVPRNIPLEKIDFIDEPKDPRMFNNTAFEVELRMPRFWREVVNLTEIQKSRNKKNGQFKKSLSYVIKRNVQKIEEQQNRVKMASQQRDPRLDGSLFTTAPRRHESPIKNRNRSFTTFNDHQNELTDSELENLSDSTDTLDLSFSTFNSKRKRLPTNKNRHVKKGCTENVNAKQKVPPIKINLKNNTINEINRDEMIDPPHIEKDIILAALSSNLSTNDNDDKKNKNDLNAEIDKNDENVENDEMMDIQNDIKNNNCDEFSDSTMSLEENIENIMSPCQTENENNVTNQMIDSEELTKILAGDTNDTQTGTIEQCKQNNAETVCEMAEPNNDSDSGIHTIHSDFPSPPTNVISEECADNIKCEPHKEQNNMEIIEENNKQNETNIEESNDILLNASSNIAPLLNFNLDEYTKDLSFEQDEIVIPELIENPIDPTNLTSATNELTTSDISDDDYEEDISCNLKNLIVRNSNTNADESDKSNWNCNICNYNAPVGWKQLIKHYVRKHPDVEIPISRLATPFSAKILSTTPIISTVTKSMANNECAIQSLCCICNDEYKMSATKWLHHMIMHTGEFEFRCNKCEKILYLDLHKKCTSTKNQRICGPHEFKSNILYGYVCALCNYVQLSKDNINKHLQNEHQQLIDDMCDGGNAIEIILLNEPIELPNFNISASFSDISIIHTDEIYDNNNKTDDKIIDLTLSDDENI